MKKIRFTNADVYKCVGAVVLLDATLQVRSKNKDVSLSLLALTTF